MNTCIDTLTGYLAATVATATDTNSSYIILLRPAIRTGYVGLNVLDIEIPNMFQSKKLSTRTRPRKVPTATTYFPVVATPGGWDLAKLAIQLGQVPPKLQGTQMYYGPRTQYI